MRFPFSSALVLVSVPLAFSIQAEQSYQSVSQDVVDLKKQVKVLSDVVKTNPAFAHAPAAGPESMPTKGYVVANDESYTLTMGGFARLDFLYTPDQIGDAEQFVTSTIPVYNPLTGVYEINGSAKYTHAKKQYHFNANRSRFFIKAERPLDNLDLKVYLEGDFWGSKFRIRHAYGQFENIRLGQGRASFLIGQTYSAFTVNESQPAVLDNQGPNSNVADRYPMLTWKHQPTDWLMYKLSVEQSQYDSTQSEVYVSGLEDPMVAVEYESTYPMLVASLLLGSNQRNIQFSAAYSHIEVDSDIKKNGPLTNQTINGYALNAGGKFAFGKKDYLRYYGIYSHGLGRLITDLETGFSNGVFGANAAGDEIEYLDSFGTMLALEHLWTNKISSNLVWGYVEVNNSAGQAGTEFKSSNYVAGNVIWRPTKQLMFGAEYIWGDRENKNGDEGDASRVQLSAQFIF